MLLPVPRAITPVAASGDATVAVHNDLVVGDILFGRCFGRKRGGERSERERRRDGKKV